MRHVGERTEYPRPVAIPFVERAQSWLAYVLARVPDPVVARVTARRPIELGGRRLDARTQHVLALVERSGRPPLDELPVALARREYARLPQVFEGAREPVARVSAGTVEGPAGPIPVRRYYGSSAGAGPWPVLVYYHGGGGVIGSLETHEGLCRTLANALRGIVVSVGYRLGPEHPFPAATDDALAAHRAIVDRVAELGGDPGRVAVGGDSMGGCLAAVVCQQTRDAGLPVPAAQWLLYPATDRVALTDSRRRLAEGFLLTESLLQWFEAHYLGDADRHDPRVSPLRHADLHGLPPAVLVTAGFDPLLDEGQAYADALAAAGVPVRYRCHDGLVHGFAQLTGVVPAARRAVLDGVAQLRACLDGAW
jgi:acetyl esterase